MFKSRLDENLKAENGHDTIDDIILTEEISGPENEGVCYEIVKEETTDEKPLTLKEARKLVEKNYFLNKADLTERFEEIFGADSDAFLRQYVRPGDFEEDVGPNDRVHRFAESSSEDEDAVPSQYQGRGYGGEKRNRGDGDAPDVDDDLWLDDDAEIGDTIHSTNRKSSAPRHTIPMTNYGKGPPPFWSNVFDDSSSDDE